MHVLLNVIWLVLAGVWLALGYLLAGIVLCLTIIGIPLGVASFKMAGAALVPFGKEIVDLSTPSAERAGSVVVPYRRRARRGLA